MKKSLLISFALVFCSMINVHAQCMLQEIPLTQRITESDLVVEGKVVSQNSYWDDNHQTIYTVNTVEVYKVFKGSFTTGSIEILTEGGTVDLDMIKVEPSLQLNLNEVGIFACIPVTRFVVSTNQKTSLPKYEAHSSLQGFVKYDLSNASAADVFKQYPDIKNDVYDKITSITAKKYDVLQAFDAYSIVNNNSTNKMLVLGITGFAPGTVTAGTKTVLTIDGTGFGAVQGTGTVGFKNSDDGGATYINPLPTQYTSWSDTQIKVEVPSKAGTGTIQVTQGNTVTSAGTLTVSYAQLNVSYDPGSGTKAYQPDHVNDNGSGGYTWQLYTGFDGNASAKASFLRALDTWRCNTSVNWSVGTTTAVNVISGDNTNVVRFDSGAELPGGVLGRCTSYWSGCSSGPNVVWYVSELDIAFDDGANWQYGTALPAGNEYDFETVAVHELGHGHQLGHVISSGAIMHYAISNGASNRSLGANDLAAGVYVQGQSTVANACGPGAMTNYASCIASTKLQAAYCPVTVANLSSKVYSDIVSGATAYQYSFVSGAFSQTYTRAQFNDLPLLLIPGIEYNKTYDVQVRAIIGANTGTYGAVCQVTTPAMPTIKLKAAYCPVSVADLNTTVYCEPVAGAAAYQYLFVSGAFSQTYIRAKYTDLNLQYIPGIAYSKTYDVQVAPIVGSVTGAYGAICQVTTPAMPTTKLKAAYCPVSVVDLNTVVYCDAVSGANAYEYLFVSGAFSQSYIRTKYTDLNLQNIPGIDYAKTYDVQVRAYVNGVPGAYGAVCQITTPAIPTTKLKAAYCPVSVASLTSTIYCDAVSGASAYEYLFVSGAFSQTYKRVQYTDLNISNILGISKGKTYDVQVRAYINGTPTAYGAVCQVTTPALRLKGSHVSADGGSGEDAAVLFDLYPNPSDGKTIHIAMVGDVAPDQIITLSIYDIYGRKIYSDKVHYLDGQDIDVVNLEEKLASGVYAVEAILNDDTRFTRKLIVQ